MENKKFEIQEFLSLGYLYLLVLGIFHNSIYYGFLGINYLDYSSILDVLLSPIAVLLSSKLLFFTVVGCILLCVAYVRFVPKYLKWSKTLKRNQTEKRLAKIDKSINAFSSTDAIIFMSALMVFSMFIGLGVGKGFKVEQQIDNKEIKVNHELLFNDSKTEQVKLLGKNSLYVFYLKEGQSDVLISPIEGNINTIRKITK